MNLGYLLKQVAYVVGSTIGMVLMLVFVVALFAIVAHLYEKHLKFRIFVKMIEGVVVKMLKKLDRTIVFLLTPFFDRYFIVMDRILRKVKEFEADREYKTAIKTGKPYFGKKFGANMQSKSEMRTLTGILSQVLVNSPSAICLEIGSWAGCSATTIGKVLKQENKGELICVDTWADSKVIAKGKTKGSDIYNLFMHNIISSGLNDVIFPVTSDSDSFFKEAIEMGAKYDFIYIDGDHSYTQASKDMKNAFQVLKVGGIMCGDDLDFFSDDVDIDFAYENREKDFAVHADIAYHPGVTLAVRDVLQNNVGVKYSIWAIVKTDENSWKPFNFIEQ